MCSGSGHQTSSMKNKKNNTKQPGFINSYLQIYWFLTLAYLGHTINNTFLDGRFRMANVGTRTMWKRNRHIFGMLFFNRTLNCRFWGCPHYTWYGRCLQDSSRSSRAPRTSEKKNTFASLICPEIDFYKKTKGKL